MHDYFIVDIGSTYTKQRLFANEKLIASSQSPTTIHDVHEGIENGRSIIREQLGSESIEAKEILASSSAAGGLRMVAMGYMARVTAKAAKEVAMSSGAKILEIISSEDTEEYKIEILKEILPDIILLAGGTDFGNEESIIENAKIIVKSNVNAMVVIAGNIAAQATVAQILKEGKVKHIRIANIMPTIHVLNVDEARNTIHKEFIKQITKAEGLSKIVKEITNDKVIPTPGAVLLAAEVLAKGTDFEEGMGDLIVVDLGGATTDIHSVIPAYSELPDEEIGLVVSNYRQVSLRSVEGNLGMRVSALGVLHTKSAKLILHQRGIKDDAIAERFYEYALSMEQDTKRLPSSDEEYYFDTLIAETAVEIALKRHAGYIAIEPDPVTGISSGMPIGRDLRNVETIIAVGGIFAYRDEEESKSIIINALKNKGMSLLPKTYNVVIDKNYILYAGGIICQKDNEYAFAILKNNLQ